MSIHYPQNWLSRVQGGKYLKQRIFRQMGKIEVLVSLDNLQGR